MSEQNRPGMVEGPMHRDFSIRTRRSVATLSISAFLVASVPTNLPAQAPAELQLPNIGDPAGAILSPQEEAKIGEAFMRNVRRSVTITTDPEIDEFIQALGYRLVAAGDAQSRNYSFFVVEDSAINAFAGPGGYIGVNSGLILTADSESEVASVLAHEIAHVNQRHLLRAVDSARRLSLPATAALIAAIALGGKNAQVAQAAITATMAGAQQAQINFTRAQEQEADRVGLQILAGAGFDPRSMPAFFEQLMRASRFAEGGAPELLRTHPVTASRVSDTRNRAELYPERTVSDSEAFAYARAKLRVLTGGDAQQTAQRFTSMLSKATGIERQALRYGRALAWAKARRYGDARAEITKLLKEDPERIALLIAASEIDAADGRIKQALTTCEQAVRIYPRNYPLTVVYAKLLLEAEQPTQARLLLQDHLRYRSGNPLLYKLLAEAEQRAGYPVEAQQALAEEAYLNGQTRQAIQHLRAARDLVRKGDFYRGARLDAKLKELEEEARQEEAS